RGGARHGLDDDVWSSGEVAADDAGEQPRIGVGGAAGRIADDEGQQLAAIELVLGMGGKRHGQHGAGERQGEGRGAEERPGHASLPLRSPRLREGLRCKRDRTDAAGNDAMADLRLSFAWLDYLHVRAVMTGSVRPDGIELVCTDM